VQEEILRSRGEKEHIRVQECSATLHIAALHAVQRTGHEGTPGVLLTGANSRMQGQPVKTGVHSALALKDIPVGCTPYTPTWAGEESSVVLVLSVP